MRVREEGTRVPGAGRVTARPRSIMGLVVRLVEPSFSDHQRRSGTDFLKGRTESRARPKRRPYLDARWVGALLHPLAFCLLQGNGGGMQAWLEGLGREDVWPEEVRLDPREGEEASGFLSD